MTMKTALHLLYLDNISEFSLCKLSWLTKINFFCDEIRIQYLGVFDQYLNKKRSVK